MAPSPLPVLTDSLSEGLAPDAPPRLAAEGDRGARQGLQYGPLEQFSKPTLSQGISVLLLI